MYKRIIFLLVLSLFTVCMIACSNQEDESDVDKNEEEATQTEEAEDAGNDADDQEVDTDVEDEQDAADKESGTVANEDSDQEDESDIESDKDLPEPIEINDRVQTDTGLIFEMEKIVFEDDHIEVHFNADNQSGYYKYLADDGASGDDDLGGITLQDDTGFDYRYVATVDDARVVLDDQEKVDGIARFTGRIEDDAQTLTLIFNPDSDDESDDASKFMYEDVEIKW